MGNIGLTQAQAGGQCQISKVFSWEGCIDPGFSLHPHQYCQAGCRRWQHKGRTSTNPALNRYGRSRSALYRADMAMENPAQWSFRALRVQRPLWVISGPFSTAVRMSAFGGKADVNHCVGECPLLAISGHPATRVRSPNSSKIGCMGNPLENAFLRPSQAATHRR